tara:strand:- start:118 stop:1440 length:1323 start_codon:yes stop_codon:yes gene_type:complete
VLVASGTYSPSTNSEVFPIEMASGIHLIGSGEEITVIDAEQTSRVLTMSECYNNFISDLTITGGLAEGESPNYYGGGIYLYNSNPILINVTITNNAATTGGGMYLSFSNSTFKHVTISNNMANSYGGGVDLHTSNCTLKHVTISSNTANWGGGIHYASNSNASLAHVTISYNQALQGGGMRIIGSDPILTNVTISNNTSSEGGGIRLFYSYPILTNVIISNNTAEYYGGGMWVDFSNPILNYVTISNNIAEYYGGGMRLSNSNPILRNVTIVNNTANNGGGGMYLNSSDPTLTNSIIWSNSPESIYIDSGIPLIIYSDIEGGWEGEGNIGDNPLFVDPENGDYTFMEGSPCIDAGIVIEDIEYCADLPDMGAYEYCEEECGTELADVTGDGQINVLDLVQISNYILEISIPAYLCAADYNQDGQINVLDLVQISNYILNP